MDLEFIIGTDHPTIDQFRSGNIISFSDPGPAISLYIGIRGPNVRNFAVSTDTIVLLRNHPTVGRARSVGAPFSRKAPAQLTKKPRKFQ
jgi:hypothetical protein